MPPPSTREITGITFLHVIAPDLPGAALLFVSDDAAFVAGRSPRASGGLTIKR